MLLFSAIVDFHLLYLYDDMQVTVKDSGPLAKSYHIPYHKCNYELVKIHLESLISKIHWMNAVIV